MSRRVPFAALVAALLLAACSPGTQVLGWETRDDRHLPWPGGPAYWGRFPNGPSSDQTFFPLMVWSQNPGNAARFQDAGVNFFTGLWEGPTEDQLAQLAAARMPVACSQSRVWQAHLDDPTVRGWFQADQPDGAQLDAAGNYGPCLEPGAVVAEYRRIRENDPTRPVFMTLGQGVVTPDWEGRGECRGRSDMYEEYVKGTDLPILVAYPLAGGLPLETIASGVETLRALTEDEKPVVAAIETTDIHGGVRPTPAQIEAEVWMALIHGAGGILYFCHRFSPAVSETACLDEPATFEALRAINERILDLAPVLNTPSVAGAVVVSSSPDVPIATMSKRGATAEYLFAVAMRNTASTVRFTLTGLGGAARAEVLGEARTVDATGGVLQDEFAPYGVHLYRIPF